jgi:transposase
LTSRQRRRLRAELKSTHDPRVVKRIMALLDLDRGASAVDVAGRLGMTRQTLYNWVRNFGEGGGPRALRDRARSGRPPKLSCEMRRVLVWLLKQPPDAWGYRAVGWTVPLLRQLLATRMRIHVSDETLRRALHRQDHAWKRPRYVLRPDPDREKKTLDSPANRATSRGQRRSRPG